MAEAETAPPPTKKSGSMKAIVVTAVLLVVEGVGIVGVMMMMGGPAKVEAQEMLEHEPSDDDKVVEVLAIEDRMANDKSGVTYIYPVEIYLQVKQRHAEGVEAELEQFHNEIRADIAAIWRTAEPPHFQEPKLESLTRKVEALMRDRFEKAKHAKEPVIEKVVIVSGTGFRVDN
jgi:hypothetical protein